MQTMSKQELATFIKDIITAQVCDPDGYVREDGFEDAMYALSVNILALMSIVGMPVKDFAKILQEMQDEAAPKIKATKEAKKKAEDAA